MKILVTGGKGFIGSALVKTLQQKGHEVQTFDMVDGQDICNPKQVETAIHGKDMVFHLAAVADLNWAREHPTETVDINVMGTANIAQACTTHGVFLQYASTCCVYGNQDRHPVDEDTLPNPAEIYACTKLAGENIIRGYHLMYGLSYNFLRFATIYGHGMRPALGVHIFFRQALLEEPLTVHGNGKQSRTLTYIDDLVSGIIATMEKGLKNEAINLTTEEEVSALEMAEMIRELTQSPSPIVHIEQRPGQTFKEQISAEKALTLLEWKAKVNFRQGLEKTYAWMLDELNNNRLQRSLSGRTADFTEAKSSRHAVR